MTAPDALVGTDPGRIWDDVVGQRDAVARLRAAVTQARGGGWNMSHARFQEPWAEPLAQVARFFAKHPEHSEIAGELVHEA